MEDKGGMYWGLFIHEIRSMSLRDGFLVFSVGNFFFFDFTNNMLSIDEGCFISFHFIFCLFPMTLWKMEGEMKGKLLKSPSNPQTAAISSKGKTYFASIGNELLFRYSWRTTIYNERKLEHSNVFLVFCSLFFFAVNKQKESQPVQLNLGFVLEHEQK